MYDREVAVPRLLHMYGVGEPLPHPALARARGALSAHYRPELGEPFVTAGCCYYRDGHDSVAFHGDRVGRARSQDTMVAIVSFGSPRKLQLRPVGGHLLDRVSRAEFAFAGNRKINSGTTTLPKPLYHVSAIEAQSEFEAGHPRLGNL